VRVEAVGVEDHRDAARASSPRANANAPSLRRGGATTSARRAGRGRGRLDAVRGVGAVVVGEAARHDFEQAQLEDRLQRGRDAAVT